MLLHLSDPRQQAECGGLTGIYRICREALVGDTLAMQPRHVEAWEGPGRGTHGNGGTLLWALVRWGSVALPLRTARSSTSYRILEHIRCLCF